MITPISILALTCYLVSVVGSVTGALLARTIPRRLILGIITVHVLMLAGLLFIPINSNAELPNPGNYLLLAAFCTGVLLSGILLRSTFPLWLKIYFAFYLLSLPAFVISPSSLIGFATSGSIYTLQPERIPLGESLYLVSLPVQPDTIQNLKQYKLIKEIGLFHKTLSREVYLPSGLDSVKLTEHSSDQKVTVRVFSASSYSDINIPINKKEKSPASSGGVELQKREE